MATRIAGQIPGPLGEQGFSTAVRGFLESRQMAEQARRDRELHSAQMRLFETQLEGQGLENVASLIGVMSSVAPKGATLAQVAPEAAQQIGQQIGADPAALGDVVLNPITPEDVRGMAAVAAFDSANPDDQRRIGELILADGKTLEEVRAAAAQGQFAQLQWAEMRQWALDQPETFREAIAQELGPTAMYPIQIGDQRVELSGSDLADFWVALQTLALRRDELALAGTDAVKEAEDRLRQQIISIGERVGVTAPPGLVEQLVRAHTDPNLSDQQANTLIEQLRGRSAEAALLVDATIQGRQFGTDVLENQFRDDPVAGPMFDFLNFVERRLDAFPAEERSQILSSISEGLERVVGVGFSTSFFRGRPSLELPEAPEGLQADVSQLARQMGLSTAEVSGLVRDAAREQGVDEQVVIDALFGREQEREPGPPPAEPAVESEVERELPTDPVTRAMVQRRERISTDISRLRAEAESLADTPVAGARIRSIQRELETLERQLQTVESQIEGRGR